MTRHHPALGIALMVAGCFVGTASDAVTKSLTISLSVAQILLGQSLLIVIALLFLAPFIGPHRLLRVSNWKSQLLRGLLHIATTFLFVTGLSELPLSTAIAIWFANPLFTAALAPWLLGERSDGRRWMAILIGFCGVIVITQRSANEFSYWVLYPFAAALCGALRDVVTRRIAIRDSSESMIFYSTIAIVIAGAIVTKGDLGTISAQDGLLLIASAGTYLLAVYFIAESLRNAEASTVTPFKYSTLVWAMVVDVLVWQRFPTWNVIAGAGVIITAMLYLYQHEKRVVARSSEFEQLKR